MESTIILRCSGDGSVTSTYLSVLSGDKGR